MNAFITGSRVYGQPTEESDVDLVILCDHTTKDILFSHSTSGTQTIRFGNLNIIAETDPDRFAEWLIGTRRCEVIYEGTDEQLGNNPVPSSQAARIIEGILTAIGQPPYVPGDGPSNPQPTSTPVSTNVPLFPNPFAPASNPQLVPLFPSPFLTSTTVTPSPLSENMSVESD